jgi:hypothetical protein
MGIPHERTVSVKTLNYVPEPNYFKKMPFY